MSEEEKKYAEAAETTAQQAEEAVKPASEEPVAEACDPSGGEEPVSELDALRNENEQLKILCDSWKNEYAKAYADAENAKKRLQKEFEQMNKYRIQSFAKEILPVLDNCERAIALKPADSQDENYRKAFEMVWKQLRSALEKEGIEEIEAENVPFDPNWHQAMMTEKVDGIEPGMVVAVLQKGYRLKDRILRAAMVKVSE